MSELELPEKYKIMFNSILGFLDILYTKNIINGDQLNLFVNNELPIYENVEKQIEYFDQHYPLDLIDSKIRIAIYNAYHLEHTKKEENKIEPVVPQFDTLHLNTVDPEPKTKKIIRKVIKKDKLPPEEPTTQPISVSENNTTQLVEKKKIVRKKKQIEENNTQPQQTQEKIENTESITPTPKKIVRKYTKKIQ